MLSLSSIIEYLRSKVHVVFHNSSEQGSLIAVSPIRDQS